MEGWHWSHPLRDYPEVVCWNCRNYWLNVHERRKDRPKNRDDQAD